MSLLTGAICTACHLCKYDTAFHNSGLEDGSKHDIAGQFELLDIDGSSFDLRTCGTRGVCGNKFQLGCNAFPTEHLHRESKHAGVQLGIELR